MSFYINEFKQHLQDISKDVSHPYDEPASRQKNYASLEETYSKMPSGSRSSLTEQSGGNAFAQQGAMTPGHARQLGSREMADAMWGPDSDVQQYTGWGPGPGERASRPFNSGRSMADGEWTNPFTDPNRKPGYGGYQGDLPMTPDTGDWVWNGREWKWEWYR